MRGKSGKSKKRGRDGKRVVKGWRIKWKRVVKGWSIKWKRVVKGWSISWIGGRAADRQRVSACWSVCLTRLFL